jgi:uncharacterized membrane protein YbhN (UPF0104 family)
MMTGILGLPTPVVRLGQIVITVALLVLVWQVVDGPESVRILATADPLWLLAALVALTLQTVLSAMRWRITAAQLGIRLPAMHALHEYYLAQLINQAAPGGVVGDAGRAVRSRADAGLLAASQAVIFERLAGQIAMFLTMAIAFLLTYSRVGGLDWPAWLVLPMMIVFAIGAATPIVFVTAIQLPVRWMQPARRFGQTMLVALAGKGVLGWQVALSIGTTACNLAAFAFCARAVGVVLPPVVVAALVPLILFTMLIPFTISGWGAREGAATVLLPLAGTSAAQGLAASVAFGLVMMVAVLPGFLALWFRSR